MRILFLKHTKLSQEKLIFGAFLVGLLIQTVLNTSLDYAFLNKAITLCVGFIIFRALYVIPFHTNTLKQTLCFGPLIYAIECALISVVAYVFWELPLLLALLLASLSAALSPALVYPKLIEKEHALSDSAKPLKLAALLDNSLTVLIAPLLLSLNLSTHLSFFSFFLEIALSLAFGMLSAYMFTRLLKTQKEAKRSLFFLCAIFGLFFWVSTLSFLSFFFMVIAFSLMLANYLEKPTYHPLKTQLDTLGKLWPYFLALTFILIGTKLQLKNLFLIDRYWLCVLCLCIGLRFFLLYILAKNMLDKKAKEALEIASMMIPKLTLQLAFIPLLINSQVPFARLLAGSLLASIVISLCFHLGPTVSAKLVHLKTIKT